jgi:hypothetical protein
MVILFGQLLQDACNIPPIARINEKKKLLQASSPTEEPFWAARRRPGRPVNTRPRWILVSSRVFRPHATSQRAVLTSFSVPCIICVYRICVVYVSYISSVLTSLPAARYEIFNEMAGRQGFFLELRSCDLAILFVDFLSHFKSSKYGMSSNTLPTPVGASHQWTIPTSKGALLELF